MATPRSTIDTATFAKLVGVSPRQAKNICRARSLRGHPLIIREVAGRGGRSGIRYEVKVSSLPADLQEALKASKTPVQLTLPLPAATFKSPKAQWWSVFLRPLLETARRSPERAAAIEAMAGKPVMDWRNREFRPTRTTIYNKLKELEERGQFARLGRSQRSDSGTARVFVSREWDQAVRFDDATKRKIADNLAQEIRELVAKGTNRKWVLLLARDWLKRDTEAHGHRAADAAELDRICTVPISHYTAQAQYRVVYDLTRDRDKFDNDLPRVKRTIAGMRPMELVVADVHPKDLLIRRSDGSVGAARLLAFMDIATRRVRAELVMIEGKGGVRNIDGIKAFVAMAQDPAWGLPEHFYVDNGSEYLFADYLADAMALTGAGRGREIIHAQPYNAAAKPIEAWFHRFESDHMRHVPGWHGGKLGAPMRPARGKLPAPFEDGFDALCEIVQGHIRAYNAAPQPHGELKTDSPASRFVRFINEVGRRR